MSAETKEIKGLPDPDEPEVTIDRVERPPMDGPKPSQPVKLLAIVAGIVGFLCFVATPLLPVVNTESSLSWPQNGSLNSVNAPLMAQAPLDMTVNIPLSLVDQLPEENGEVLLASKPKDSLNPTERGMQVRNTDDGMDVIFKDRIVLSLTAQEVNDNKDKTLSIHSTEAETSASVAGANDAEGQPLANTIDEDIRPQVTGIYTDLPADGDAAAATAAGLDVQMKIDSRYTSHPTVLKYIVMWVGLLLTLASLWALGRVDRIDGSTRTPWLGKGALRPRLLDGVVAGVLLIWHIIGANTSDDGYIMTMARVADESGYMANYYRWFGAPESPFGSPYYDILALMVKVSTSSVWLRLPALLSALAIWFMISRLIIPRLGKEIAQRRVAYWSAAGVLLAFWLPFNNGLRPEPVIAMGALATWVFIERAILTRRLLPAAIGVIIATLALGSGPTGLMAVAALLAGLPMLVRIVVERHRPLGGGVSAPLMQVAPFLAAGTAILVGVFGDQTLATVLESVRVRGILGPSLNWYEEPIRYYWLVIPSPDGSMTRRFAVLMALMALVLCIAALLRHRTVPGALAAPAARLVFVFIGTMFLMTFTPTKWTHHFGVYAGIGAALAALAAMAISHWVAGNRRNQLLFIGAVVFLLAFCVSSTNGWWYVAAYGIPWFDKTVQIRGIQAGSVVLAIALLILAAAAVMAFVQEFSKGKKKPGNRKSAKFFKAAAGSPIAVASFLMVAFALASFAKGAYSQFPAYSLAMGNARALTGQTCNLAADVLMEEDINKGYLTPVGDKPFSESLGDPEGTGFDPNGMPKSMDADPIYVGEGQSNSVKDEEALNPNVIAGGGGADTDGGTAEKLGVNGSRMELPFGLDNSKIPVLGSYSEKNQRVAKLATEWFNLPARDENHPLLVVTAAGRIYHHDLNGVEQKGAKLVAQWGRPGPNNEFEVIGEQEPLDIGPSPSWRNLRFVTDQIPAEATAVRLSVEDTDLAEDQWVALTPPRLAELTPMTEVITPDVPTIPDWSVAFQFPCQRPFDHYAGVAEIPRYRITPERELKIVGPDTWQSDVGGGPLGLSDAVNESVTVSTYLKNDWGREWGSVEKLAPRPNEAGVAPDVAEIQHTDVVHNGLYSPGQMIVQKQ